MAEVESRRDGSVLTISDSPLGTLLRDVPNHDYLKLPAIVKAGPGGDFGKDLYAITRGLGENAQLFPGSVSRPGVRADQSSAAPRARRERP